MPITMTYEQLQAYYRDANADLHEAHLEIERHHRDFEAIRTAVHEALDAPARSLPDSRNAFRDALQNIRGIVG